MARLKSIKTIKVNNDKVYDITVEDNHNYIASGMVVSNSGSSSYTDVIADLNHIYYRFGFSGTFVRNDYKTIHMHSLIASEASFKYAPTQAIKDGFLTPLQYTSYDVAGIAKKDALKEIQACYTSNTFIAKILEITLSLPKDEPIMVLVKEKEKSGDLIQEALTKCGINSTYINGDTPSKIREKIICDFNDEKIPVLVGTSVIGEGIDIRATKHLFLAQGGQSEIQVVQAVGRLARLFPNKTIGTIHDFCFYNTNYQEKHYKTRKSIIKEYFDPEFT